MQYWYSLILMSKSNWNRGGCVYHWFWAKNWELGKGSHWYSRVFAVMTNRRCGAVGLSIRRLGCGIFGVRIPAATDLSRDCPTAKRSGAGARFDNKRPTGLNGHLSIGDFTLTSCQKGAYLHINKPHHRIIKYQQWHKNRVEDNAFLLYGWYRYALEQDPCPWVHEINNLGRPLLYT